MSDSFKQSLGGCILAAMNVAIMEWVFCDLVFYWLTMILIVLSVAQVFCFAMSSYYSGTLLKRTI